MKKGEQVKVNAMGQISVCRTNSAGYSIGINYGTVGVLVSDTVKNPSGENFVFVFVQNELCALPVRMLEQV